MKKWVPGLLLLFSCLGRPAFADDRLYFESGPLQNTFVELYTSDANANCNPALAWMSSLKDKDPGTVVWKTFVPVALHVHQWDIPGYKDSFAQKGFDESLQAYKKKWNATNVYAPTMVVNGIEWSGWARGQDIPLERERQTGTLKVDGTKHEGQFEVSFAPSKILEKETFTVHSALLAFGLESRPTEGKNRGRTLTHDFLAMMPREQDLRLSYGVLTATLEISRPKGLRVSRYALVFWVTVKGDTLPVQAAAGELPL